MYLPTDETLVTAVVLAKQNEAKGDRAMMMSWTILAHNYAGKMGYYGDLPFAPIDWEDWVQRQK